MRPKWPDIFPGAPNTVRAKITKATVLDEQLRHSDNQEIES